MPKKLLLLDAYALIYRAYFAFINRPIRNSKGLNTSAVYGFTKTLLDALKRFEPTHIAVAFDLSGPTFRTELFPEYKANREETPEDIRLAIPIIKELLQSLNITILQMKGFEADDIIGSMAKQAERQGFEVLMMTPDKDYGQLLSDNITVIKPGRSGGDIETVTKERFCKEYGITAPDQFIDILALWGDKSDNIPGIPGIGEKTAAKLISQYGTIDAIIENIDKLSKAQKENILANKEQLYLARTLTTIKLDINLELHADELIRKEYDKPKLKAILEEMEFKSLLKELVEEPKPVAPTAVQGNLFGFDDTVKPAVQSDYLTIADKKVNYQVMANPDQRKELIATLSSAKEICFDTETTGLDPITSTLVGLSFAVKEGTAWYVPIPSNQQEAQGILNEFKPIFENEGITKIGQNIKFDLLMLRAYGVTLKGYMFDTMLAHYLLEPDMRHNMNYLAEQLLNYKPIEIEELIGKKGAGQLNMRSIPVDKISVYAAEDADITLQLKNILEPRLQNEGLTELYNEIEAPLVEVLAEMELTGVKIDSNSLNDFGKTLNAELINLDNEIKELAQTPDLNISSPKQLGEVLFEKLKIASDVKMTKTKQYSTSEEELLKYKDKHPIIDKILEFRSIKKLLSTYIEALPALVSPKTGRIHASFNQAVAATGRLSSNNPNLQNIPIREERGREIRKAFIPSDDNHIILSADYSQIELRLMAHMSQDPSLCEAFLNNEDIHTATAAKIFKVPISEVTREQRSSAKTANFGMIYGISAFGLSQRLNISRTEAKELIDGYFGTYTGVKTYMDRCIANAREKGYVTTLLGRKRYLPDIRSNNGTVRGLAERNAINAPIQGSAADIIKVAMIRINKRLKQENLLSKMIIQVHDELVFDALKSELPTLQQLVKEEMEGAIKLSVPLIAESGVGENWLKAH
ncbi:MAG: DNA polymerase I [Bacteroidales bacterium]|nr:DNA polymerase I [Bacteroidales bacterium]MBN2749993.1 DNA polymerase I [Bacteroidales bacterium]